MCSRYWLYYISEILPKTVKRMASAPQFDVLEHMMAALAMSEEDMANFAGPWVGGECKAPCCLNSPPEERARAARLLLPGLQSGKVPRLFSDSKA